jgi:hypothetical protein
VQRKRLPNVSDFPELRQIAQLAVHLLCKADSELFGGVTTQHPRDNGFVNPSLLERFDCLDGPGGIVMRIARAPKYAFEDFCSRRPAARRSNVIDDYLDQRGWKESIQARDYLRALRGSVMSLYEVVEVKPGRGLVL